MKRQLQLVALAAALTAAIVFASCGGGSDLPPVKALHVRDLRGLIAAEGGEVTVLNIWASWCDPCREEIPDLVKLRKEYNSNRVVVIFLSADDPEDIDPVVRPLLAGLDVDFTTYFTADSSDDAFIDGISPEWNGALPATILYDRSGSRREMFVGKQTYGDLKDAVEGLLPR